MHHSLTGPRTLWRHVGNVPRRPGVLATCRHSPAQSLNALFFGRFGCLVVLLAGCGKNPLGPVVPVSGKVTLNGKPLPAALVTFVPDPSKGNKVQASVFALVGTDGEYHLLTTTREEAGPRTGAPTGWYRVKVAPAMPANLPVPGGPPGKSVASTVKLSSIPARYQDANTTPISVEVRESAQAESYDLKLVTKK
jgi:hypothetical protein